METDGVFLCIFKIHVYFQDTYFQDVISTKKYTFSAKVILNCVQVCFREFTLVFAKKT